MRWRGEKSVFFEGEIRMREMLCIVLSFAVFFAGCAGRNANPVPLYIPGDENRPCESLNRRGFPDFSVFLYGYEGRGENRVRGDASAT